MLNKPAKIVILCQLKELLQKRDNTCSFRHLSEIMLPMAQLAKNDENKKPNKTCTVSFLNRFYD
jgi:hypothetical protein